MRNTLFLLSVTVVILTTVFVYINDNRSFRYKPGTSRELDTAVNQARYIYKLRKNQGQDLSQGPCLSNALINDWVLDIAHNPRQKIDDLVQNQCSAYLEGKAHHFIELDLDGKLIRAK